MTSSSHPTPQIDGHEFENPIYEFSSGPPADMMGSSTDNLLICTACGTQFDIEDRNLLKRCRICDDPRQFVPPTGQAFTTLAALKAAGHTNNRKAFDNDDRFWSIWVGAGGESLSYFKYSQGLLLRQKFAGNVPNLPKQYLFRTISDSPVT
jgi:hypothetical protein